MGKSKEVHVGSMVRITKRLCGDKVQPTFKVGMMVAVKGVSNLKDGTQVLTVANPNRKGATLRINANRFQWEVVTFEDLKEMKFQKEVDDETDMLMKVFSQKEQIDITFVPLVIQSIAWVYAQKCIDLAVENRISIVNKLTRAVRFVRKEYENELCRDLKDDSLHKIERETQRFMQTYSNDFMIFYFTVMREYDRHYRDTQYEDLHLYAIMGMLFIKLLDKYNDEMAQMVEQRLGIVQHSMHMSSMDKLYSSLDAYAGHIEEFNFEERDVVMCMKIFRNRISEIQFSIDK